MEVELIEYSDNPEEIIATAARNDYYDGWVEDDTFEEVMEGVSYDDRHYEESRERLMEEVDDWDLVDEQDVVVEAQKQSLVEDLYKKEHFGPAEHPQFIYAIKGVSRSLMSQITRHRHMSFDVQSMRYVDFGDTEPVVPPTLEDGEGHLSREKGLVDLDDDVREEYAERYEELMDEVTEFYQDAVEDGVPKEDARYAMPIGTPVNMVVSGNLRTMLHVLNMRGKADAQHEIRELTEKMGEELDDAAPITAQYFEENGPFKLGM